MSNRFDFFHMSVRLFPSYFEINSLNKNISLTIKVKDKRETCVSNL